MIVRGEGAYIYDINGKRYLDGLSGLFVVQAGHGRQELADAAAKQAAELAYFPLWSYAHPTAVELADRLADLDPGRPQPGLLHHRRLGGGRDGVEAGPLVLQAGRQADQAQGDLAAHRLPRHLDGRAVDHRPARHQGRLRAARALRRPGAEHEPLPGAGRDGRPGRYRRRGVRPVGRRPDRRGDRVRGPGHGGRRVPRAGAELRRLLPAAARLLRTGSARSATATTCCSSPTR